MPIDRQEALEKLSRMPDRLERVVEEHPNDLLCQPGAGGGWGAVEIMAFLRDWDEVFADRLNQILTESEPEFDEEDPDLWSIERDYHAEVPDTVVSQFRQGRTRLVARLRDLSDDDWQRTARMPDGGVATVEDLVADLIKTDHRQMTALRDIVT